MTLILCYDNAGAEDPGRRSTTKGGMAATKGRNAEAERARTVEQGNAGVSAGADSWVFANGNTDETCAEETKEDPKDGY